MMTVNVDLENQLVIFVLYISFVKISSIHSAFPSCLVILIYIYSRMTHAACVLDQYYKCLYMSDCLGFLLLCLFKTYWVSSINDVTLEGKRVLTSVICELRVRGG